MMKRYLHVVAVAAVAGAFAAGAIQSLLTALANQSERVPPTSGIYTGVQFSQLIGDAMRSVSSGNKGSSAPANVGSTVIDGLEWIDDSVTPWLKKRYVNGGWAVEGALDPADSSYVGVIGGGVASIASAATVDLGSVPQANVLITGTTTITGFGSSAPIGVVKVIRFDNTLTLTHSSALTVPGGYSLATAANDRAIVTHLGSGNWEVTQYTRASGIPIDVAAVGKIEFTLGLTVPPLHVAAYGQALSRAAYPAYLAKVTRVQNGTRVSGNATITGLADTSGLQASSPVEGTGIAAGCTIATIGANSITLNSSACVTSSGTSPVTIFPYGYGSGGDATTVGVRDCRNFALAGRDRNDPGSFSGRLTASYFGATSSIFGAVGGSENVSMAAGNLIAHTHANSLTDPGHFHQERASNAGGVNQITLAAGSGVDVTVSQVTTTSTTGITITNASAGFVTPTPMRTVQPTMVADCIVRVTP